MHSLFVGVTLTGKTTLARDVTRAMRARGHTVIVFDPVGSPTAGGGWGDGSHIFGEESAFLTMMEDERVRHAHVFVDEADLVFNHARPENRWMLTRGRHFGFSMNLITQRPALIDPTVRGQCTRLYMFRLAKADRKLLGEERGFDDFAEYDLDAGEFLIADSGQREVKRANLRHLLKKET